MFSVDDVRNTLKIAGDKNTILALKLNERLSPDGKAEFAYPELYQKIYENISYILSKLDKVPQGMSRRLKGLSVKQLSFVMNRMDDAWPDIWIATAIRYQLLKVSNKNYSIEEIMEMKFNNLDKPQVSQGYSRFTFANLDM